MSTETTEERVRREAGRCPSFRWFPFYDGDDFGYQEYWCAGPLDHSGDHSSDPSRFADPTRTVDVMRDTQAATGPR